MRTGTPRSHLTPWSPVRFSLVDAQVAEPGEIKDRWLPVLLGPLAASRKLPGSTALVVGVAAGLSCMLGAPGLLPGFPAASDKLRNNTEAGNAILKVNYFQYNYFSFNLNT